MAVFAEIMARASQILRALVVPYEPHHRFIEAPDKVLIDDHPGYRYAYRLFRIEVGTRITPMEYVGPHYAMNQEMIVHVAYFFDLNSVEAAEVERMAATDMAYIISAMKSPPPQLAFDGLASQLTHEAADLEREDNFIKIKMSFDVGYELT